MNEASGNSSRPSEPLSILLLNQTWFVDELRAMGHRVISAGWLKKDFDIRLKRPGRSILEVLQELPRSFTPDRMLYYDDSGPVGVVGLEELEIPCLYYSVDAHHHVSWQKAFGALFDAVLVAQKNYLSGFKEFAEQVEWFPLWAPLDLEPAPEKTCDVSFRGNLDKKLHPARAKFFAELKEHIAVDTKTGKYQEIFPHSRIVVNQAVKDDLNFRAFEAMMSGAMLLTPYQDNGLFELFEEGVDLVLYENGSSHDAAEKIKYYLEHEELRAEIARHGRAKILDLHSKQVRAEQLERRLRTVEVTSRPFRYFGAGLSYAAASRTCRRVSDELGNKMLHEAAKNLRLSALAGEYRGSEFGAAVHVVKYDYQRFSMESEVLGFIEAIYQAYPGEEIFAFSYIETLLETQQFDKAKEIARRISDKPQEVIEAAPRLMSSVRIKALETPSADSLESQ